MRLLTLRRALFQSHHHRDGATDPFEVLGDALISVALCIVHGMQTMRRRLGLCSNRLNAGFVLAVDRISNFFTRSLPFSPSPVVLYFRDQASADRSSLLYVL